MSVYDIVRRAIRNKEIIVATYDGFVREMCPHVLGTKDGVEHALFLQVGGGSSSLGLLHPMRFRRSHRALFPQGTPSGSSDTPSQNVSKTAVES